LTEDDSLGARVGAQLLDVSVRVKELRPEATRAAETLVLLSNRTIAYPKHGSGQNQIIKSAAWICGEFAVELSNPYEVLNSLIHESSESFRPNTIATFVQAVPKIISHIASTSNQEWNVSRGTTMSLLLARTTGFLERLSSHPNLEVQERSVEFLELLRLAGDAISSQEKDSIQAPLLLTSAIPSLFSGMELNPVFAAAQKKVPMLDDLDLDTPINSDLSSILQASQTADEGDSEDEAFRSFYHDREPVYAATSLQPAIAASRLVEPSETDPISYQSAPESPQTRARRKAERMARNKDDPFYIAPAEDATPRIHDAISQANGGEELDVDSIPIIDLHIDHAQTTSTHTRATSEPQRIPTKKKTARRFVVTADEMVNAELDSGSGSYSHSHPASNEASLSTTPLQAQSAISRPASQSKLRPTRNLLTVDSSTLQQLSLEGPGESESDILRREAEELEMTMALRDVERKRLEMQREAERGMTMLGEGVDAEGTVVKRKKKKKPKATDVDQGITPEVVEDEGEDRVVKKKRKKRKKVTAEEDSLEQSAKAETVSNE
jgi:AP-3 complex subunit delta-1